MASSRPASFAQRPPIVVEHRGVEVSLEPEEHVTGRVGLQLLLQSGILSPSLENGQLQDDNATTAGASGENELQQHTRRASMPKSPPIGSSNTLEILEYSAGHGSCTHLLAEFDEAGIVTLSPGQQLCVTAMQTPEAFRLGTSDVAHKIERHRWSNVRLLKGDMSAIPFNGPHFHYILANLCMAFCPVDDDAMHEIYRCLLPGGIAGFTSWKQLGWSKETAQEGQVDPLMIMPSNGWRDADYIKRKLTSHGFQDIEISEVSFQTDVDTGLFTEVVGRVVRHAVKRLWQADNTEVTGADDTEAIAQTVLDQYDPSRFNGKMAAWVTIARKRNLST